MSNSYTNGNEHNDCICIHTNSKYVTNRYYASTCTSGRTDLNIHHQRYQVRTRIRWLYQTQLQLWYVRHREMSGMIIAQKFHRRSCRSRTKKILQHRRQDQSQSQRIQRNQRRTKGSSESEIIFYYFMYIS